jgi:hypothetical protein
LSEGGQLLCSHKDYAQEVDALNHFYASILALANQPRSLRQKMVDMKVAQALVDETTLLTKWLLPAESECLGEIRKSEAFLRCTQCLVALRRWQLQHADAPPDLETLVKSAALPRVPMDPYSDQPSRMGSVEGRPVIYSVGPDGRDDKAQFKWDYATWSGDFIFQLEKPAQ